jgi:hypothetical protein
MVFAPSTIAVTAVAVITANVHLDYRPTGVRTLVLAQVTGKVRKVFEKMIEEERSALAAPADRGTPESRAQAPGLLNERPPRSIGR